MMEIFPDPAAAADAAAAAAAGALSVALARQGRASLVATGGRAPGPVYDRLHAARLDWANVVVTLSDDRFVDADSPQSNARLVRERLLVGDAARARFIPLAQGATPEAAALTADPLVRQAAPFDVMLLGMGEDGHVASLIPGAGFLPAAMDPACPRHVMGTGQAVGQPPLPRITLTLRALLEARAILLLIAGDAKREVIARAKAGANLPVRSLLGQDRAPLRILWSPSHEG